MDDLCIQGRNAIRMPSGGSDSVPDQWFSLYHLARGLSSKAGEWVVRRRLPFNLRDSRNPAMSIDEIHEFEKAELLVKSGLTKFPWLNNSGRSVSCAG